ncbi:DNA-processing protein DprA [Nocardioides sp. YIM 152315]|uniref:DNA-processing protein DprA n=1 Tax=Nocardioides sp. YIM 152315 TaxID=3031760 RepID=UPI0023DB050D|nr:DNA-processing protein DprA [Nocardioides sp. YIM 152315]MDF1602802.1 DNA-processing protein DprA [Nocardioides sp. YIM 152315]
MKAPVDADRMARVVLGRIAEPGKASLLDAVSELGAVEVRDRLAADPVLGPRVDGVDPERELDRAARSGLRFVVPGDDEWPSGLDDLARTPAVQERGGVPLGLWVRGPVRLDALDGAVAVVGSRSATTYGDDVARGLAADIARAGRIVVSGAAYGIDQAAHRGAIAADAPTVAVLACGADKVYPERHADLLAHLAVEGAVISETVPGGAAMRVRFLTRNRLIAALTGGTVVVEAALRSGALNTANWATRLNRQLMGVPGPVTSATSAGVHQLVRTGAATLVTSGAEVLEVLGAAGEHLLVPPRGRERPRDTLTDRQRLVLDAVPVARGATSASVARIVGLGTDAAHAALLELEVRGMVQCDEGGWRLAALAHD